MPVWCVPKDVAKRMTGGVTTGASPVEVLFASREPSSGNDLPAASHGRGRPEPARRGRMLASRERPESRFAASFAALLLGVALSWSNVAAADTASGEARSEGEAPEREIDDGADTEQRAQVQVLLPDEDYDDSADALEFDLKVRSLEERVTDMKERVFQTKARLMLLQETVIGGDLSTGARLVLVHRNEMGASFVLESITFILDGAPIFSRVDPTGELNRQKEIEIFNGRIVPGTHQIGVRMVYRGSGYGVFSYLNDWRFRVQSSHTFSAEGGKLTRVDVVSFERGGITTELQDRPRVRYEEEVTRELPGTRSETARAEEPR